MRQPWTLDPPESEGPLFVNSVSQVWWPSPTAPPADTVVSGIFCIFDWERPGENEFFCGCFELRGPPKGVFQDFF